RTLDLKETFVLGLATGNTPTGLYKHLAKAANEEQFDSSRIVSFNLDEYIGLPGENAQQRALHRESYSFFMVQELFGLLQKKFRETNVPWGTLIDQKRLVAEMEANPGDWSEQGTDKGKAIVIREDAQSAYLRWVRKETLDAYVEKIERTGGIDLHIIGVGGRGHVAFHESGIPFENNRMLMVKLDENTVSNAVSDGHFSSRSQSPWYALSMGAEQVFRARTVVLLANGPRKAGPVAESLLNEPSPAVPISYGQIFARRGGTMIYVIDREAAGNIHTRRSDLSSRGITVRDISNEDSEKRVEDLAFRRNPATCLMG
ncbi:MAG: 6-phosphogluconolactonase, partial [Desulfomonilia bacterium]|nr:6-phosphogluconolactonase [Desulfomonilia bacterium]